MDQAVVTSAGPAGYEQYGQRFLDTFAQHWPPRLPLIYYREGDETHLRAEMRDLMRVDGCRAFVKRRRRDLAAHGREERPCWSRHAVAKGYSYRTDAVKFCRKVFALADAAEQMQRGILAWCDADVVTFADVGDTFLPSILQGADVAYLGRGNTHSECGFVVYRLPEALPLIRFMRFMYASDRVFDLPEWHDSFVFDFARGKFPLMHQRDLTPGGRGHVWFSSPLGQVMDHLKGPRKEFGMSVERMNQR